MNHPTAKTVLAVLAPAVALFGFLRESPAAEKAQAAGASAPSAIAAAAATATRSAPKWDASSLGALPWQGIACLDVTDDATRVAVGTIAPPGDPNVFVLDAEGRVLVEQSVGQRWIDQVAVDSDRGVVRCVCGTPSGTADDGPQLFAVSPRGATLEPPNQLNGQTARWYYHYGDHSNHLARFLRRSGNAGVVATGDEVGWLDGDAGRRQYVRLRDFPQDGVVTAMAAADGDYVAVGWAASKSQVAERPGARPPANLVLLRRRETAQLSQMPVWSREVENRVEPAPAPEPGEYGSPTPNGEPGVPTDPGAPCPLAQRDDKVYAPLSIALYAPPGDRPEAAASRLRVAVADHQGWHRYVRSNATGDDESRCVRFTPSRPTVSVYDGQGRVVRTFPAQRFLRPGWLDLRFLARGEVLLAFPHHWTSRGLAGQPRLPADGDARVLYVLHVATGAVKAIAFPADLCDVACAPLGRIAVSCWNGQVYLLEQADLERDAPPSDKAVDVGGPCLVRASRDGHRIVAATHAGAVVVLDHGGKAIWRRDLGRIASRGSKPWMANARAGRIAPGLWSLPGGRVESDLCGQYLVEAPAGLVLVEAHAGLSFEREWAAIQSAGLDPKQVKYVLLTHEHGDHAPGAYLWRLATGAKVVAAREAAYTLRHHIPMGTGYGFHPPQPVDIAPAGDQDLDLAGLRVRALRAPGHTFGSLAYLFEHRGKRYLATGDLIGNGSLGYSGSVNFSAPDALKSITRLHALQADVLLTGHGGADAGASRLAWGLRVGRATGWGKMRPEQPDPRIGIAGKNTLVVGRLIGATSADMGDVDGDGRPDVAVVSPAGSGSIVRVYLNKSGAFAERPDATVVVHSLPHPTKIRLRQLNDDSVADMLASGTGVALLFSEGTPPGQGLRYRVCSVDVGTDVHQVRRIDRNAVAGPQIVLATRHSGWRLVLPGKGSSPKLANDAWRPQLRGAYADLREIDLNGDGRADLVHSYGQVFLRSPGGLLPEAPSQTLPVWKDDWTLLAAGDFNGDRRPDVALLAHGMEQARLALHLNTGDKTAPYKPAPDASFDLAFGDKPNERRHLLRDAPTVGDWNADGIDDLVLGKAQTRNVLILLGGPGGLSPKRSLALDLEFRLHYETGLHVADYNGDGKPDLAAFGYTDETGAGFAHPLGVFVWLQP